MSNLSVTKLLPGKLLGCCLSSGGWAPVAVQHIQKPSHIQKCQSARDCLNGHWLALVFHWKTTTSNLTLLHCHILCHFALRLRHTTSISRRISSPLHGALSKCIVCPSVKSAPWSVSNIEMFNFGAATDPLSNQSAVMQMHYWDATWTLSNEIVFVIQSHACQKVVSC